MSVTVLKLGGSLLDLADLPQRLRAMLATFPNQRPLLICGGGDAADVVRRWHKTHELDEEHAHWLAMEAIRLNQALLASLLADVEIVTNRVDAVSAWDRGAIALLDLPRFVRDEEAVSPIGQHLPHTWDVTSDSLAAWVALRWSAERLVLLKSVDRPCAATITDLAQQGLVDRHFPIIAPRLPQLDWINLRG
jgi:aspartokinase-like uncharacterized kinase